MKMFRFNGDPSEYTAWDEKPIVGKVYNGDHKSFIGKNGVRHTVFDAYQQYPEEWEEVAEEIPVQTKEAIEWKKFHKDTDLGHFAGLAMQGILSNPDPNAMPLDERHAAKLSIIIAKELIKQLDKEVGNE